MRHEMLTQRALFCHRGNTKRGTLSQHFVTLLWGVQVCFIMHDLSPVLMGNVLVVPCMQADLVM